MAGLKIARDNHGHIVTVSEAISIWRVIRIMPVFVALFLYSFLDLRQKNLAFNPAFGRAQWDSVLLVISAALIVVGVVGVIRSVIRPLRARPLLLADMAGLRFRLYPEIGIVPWSSAIGFRIASGLPSTLGTWVLISDLKDEDSFIHRVDPNNLFSPGKPAAPPFGTVAGDSEIDVNALRTALEELQMQVAAAKRSEALDS